MKKLRTSFLLYCLLIFNQVHSQGICQLFESNTGFNMLSNSDIQSQSFKLQYKAIQAASYIEFLEFGNSLNHSSSFVYKQKDSGFINRQKFETETPVHSTLLFSDQLFNIDDMMEKYKTLTLPKHGRANAVKINHFQYKPKGCFVSGTPVHTSKGLISIEEIDLGDLVWANKHVATISPLVASLEEEFEEVMFDPWASDEQHWVDKQDLHSETWYRISLELEYADSQLSILKLLRPKSWIEKHKIGIDTDKIWISMPEQGLEGYAILTGLAKFHVPKKPDYENKAQSVDLTTQEVTGVFKHQSRDVWKLEFENLSIEAFDSLRVTSSHPFFSLDYLDWRLVSELNIGERVLTKLGELNLRSKTKLLGTHQVYNLEVREFHNFLVGQTAIVVHNSCWKEKD